MKKLSILFGALIATTALWANGTEINGIYYILAGDTATVTYMGNEENPWQDNNYSGDIVIPSSVNYASTTYRVACIGENAFAYCHQVTSITLPNSLTSIKYSAFDNCGVQNLTVPSSVTSIDWGAFRDILNVNYYGTATGSPWEARCINGYIDGYLVYSNATKEKLVACSSSAKGEIVVASNCTEIAERAFATCYNISVVLPNGLTTIGAEAFTSSHISTISIPASVTSIGERAFSYFDGLIQVDAGNKNYSSVDGVLYNYAKTTLIQYPRGKYEKEFTIPNGVTTIGLDAFSNYNLKSVTLPNSLTRIENNAFQSCSNLYRLDVPSTVSYIGEWAFSGITLVYYYGSASGSPWGATCINGYEEGYFIYANSNKETLVRCNRNATGDIIIPNTVKTISDDAFYNCSKITSVYIPNSVTSIGNDAFCIYNDANLFSITVPSSVVSIGWSAFQNIPNVVYHGTATWESYQKYWGAKCLNGYIEDDILYTSVYKDTLVCCRGTVKGSINIPNTVVTICDEAFRKCSNLTAITIPNSVRSIGRRAFFGCFTGTTLNVPNSVVNIGEYAFSSVLNLSYYGSATGSPWGARCLNGFVDGYLVYENSSRTKLLACSRMATGEIVVPNTVIEIGEEAFAYCYYITSIVLPNSITKIGAGAFEGCEQLQSINLPNQLTEIVDNLFAGCFKLSSVTIPTTVQKIGEYAFASCIAILKRDIPSTVTEIGEGAFEDVSIISYNGSATGAPWGAKSMNGYIDGYIAYTDASKTHILGCSSNATGTLTLPNTVTTIDDYAFICNTGLLSVVVPNSVNKVGEEAFYGVNNVVYNGTLKGAPWDAKCLNGYVENNTLVYTDASRTELRGCVSTAKGKVIIPASVTTIYDEAFMYCFGITSLYCYAATPPTCEDDWWVEEYMPTTTLYVPSQSISIYKNTAPWSMFNRIVSLPNGQCGDHLFWEYKQGTLSITGSGQMYDFTTSDIPWEGMQDSIENIVVANGVTSIGDYAFYGCGNKNLQTIHLPNSILNIGDYAFANCAWLRNITFGTLLEDIGNNAFYGDQRLIYINCYATIPPVLGTSPFANYSAYLKVPCTVKDEYAVSLGWSEFTNLSCIGAEEVSEPITTVTTTPTDNSVTITWPTDANAGSYTIEIKKDDVVFCTLTFNAQGQLTSIAFAPGRGGSNDIAMAEAVTGGYKFTVTSLTPATKYNYEIDTKNASGTSLANYSGEFTTKNPTALDQLTDSPINRFTKVIKDGQLLILRDNKTYNAQGAEIK